VVYNDPATTLRNTINRALSMQEKFGKGRWIALNYLIGSFKKNKGKIEKLLEAYPEIRITCLDNTQNSKGLENKQAQLITTGASRLHMELRYFQRITARID